jgi:asparagine synthase (glutamine-hydrolysing)
MCGICGIAAPGGALDPARASRDVHRMIEVLAHRGPDDAGVHAAASAVLGATRLAIRGLEDGRQPIADPATGVVAVCNGEIDNHGELRAWLAARGRPVALATDVAVIPGLYLELGEPFVERLVGAFAIALWDPRAGHVLLARDRAGERPLFYHVDQVDGRLIRFATEVAALAAPGRGRFHPDHAALVGYLRCGYFTAPATPFVEIQKVAPGEVVKLDHRGVRRWRYWRWPVGAARQAPASSGDFDAILQGSVRRQMDVDVECGVFLSGGLDSSLVAAVARQIAPARRLPAYTLGFEEPSYDESPAARAVAARLGCPWTLVRVTPDMLPDSLAELVRGVGEPLADPAWVPTAALARRAAADVKLALVGEGADELFGGYPTYIGAAVAESYLRLPRIVRATLRAIVTRWPTSERKVAVSYLLKRFVAAIELDAVERHGVWTSAITPDLLARLGVPMPARGRSVLREPLLDVVQRLDLETALAEGLLTKADRASMRSALELRAPFLDHAVLEFAATLPPEERVRGLRSKVFLKRFARRYLPRSVVERRKRGLSVPLTRWLRGPLHAWAAVRLADDGLQMAGVNPEIALALLEEHRTRRADHARALWTLIVLAEWVTWTVRGRDTPSGAE